MGVQVFCDYPTDFEIPSLERQRERIGQLASSLLVPAAEPTIEVPDGFDGLAFVLKRSVGLRLGIGRLTDIANRSSRAIDLPSGYFPPDDHLRDVPWTIGVWQEIERRISDSDFVVLPVSYGRLCRGKSVYEINMLAPENGWLPLGLHASLAMLVSIPRRFVSWQNLRADIPGTLWPCSDAGENKYTRSFYMATLSDCTIACCDCYSHIPYRDHGSAIASIAHLNL